MFTEYVSCFHTHQTFPTDSNTTILRHMLNIHCSQMNKNRPAH